LECSSKGAPLNISAMPAPRTFSILYVFMKAATVPHLNPSLLYVIALRAALSRASDCF
jgi:hypothetical protein